MRLVSDEVEGPGHQFRVGRTWPDSTLPWHWWMVVVVVGDGLRAVLDDDLRAGEGG